MKATTTLATSNSNVPVIILGLVAALLVLAVLSGRPIPVLSNYRWALVALVALGMAICSQAGIGRVAAIGAWGHPLAIAGYIIGAVILLIAIAAIFGKVLPPLVDFRQAFIAVTMLAALKVVIATIHRML